MSRRTNYLALSRIELPRKTFDRLQEQQQFLMVSNSAQNIWSIAVRALDDSALKVTAESAVETEDQERARLIAEIRELNRKDRKMNGIVPSATLKFLDVIQSKRFVHGHRRKTRHGDLPIVVGSDKRFAVDPSSDRTRATAKFLVLSAELAGNLIAYGGPHSVWRQITAMRLNDDGSFNPEGEKITFSAGRRQNSDIEEVTRVGQMSLTFVPIQ
jgi:hypothetical protein